MYQLNLEELGEMYLLEPAKSILDYFSSSSRYTDRYEETVDFIEEYLKENPLMVRQNVVIFFQCLEQIGVGHFIKGSGKSKSRFRSYVELQMLGKTASVRAKTAPMSYKRNFN
jgi:hypothetical protein